jgi:hypothetical protein
MAVECHTTVTLYTILEKTCAVLTQVSMVVQLSIKALHVQLFIWCSVGE